MSAFIQIYEFCQHRWSGNFFNIKPQCLWQILYRIEFCVQEMKIHLAKKKSPTCTGENTVKDSPCTKYNENFPNSATKMYNSLWCTKNLSKIFLKILPCEYFWHYEQCRLGLFSVLSSQRQFDNFRLSLRLLGLILIDQPYGLFAFIPPLCKIQKFEPE